MVSLIREGKIVYGLSAFLDKPKKCFAKIDYAIVTLFYSKNSKQILFRQVEKSYYSGLNRQCICGYIPDEQTTIIKHI